MITMATMITMITMLMMMATRLMMTMVTTIMTMVTTMMTMMTGTCVASPSAYYPLRQLWGRQQTTTTREQETPMTMGKIVIYAQDSRILRS